jgi:hypothetical protein
MNYGHNMDPDIEKLISLLKKILRKNPMNSDQVSKLGDFKGVNLNICFVTLLPMTPEELDEFNESLEDYLNGGEEQRSQDRDPDLEFKLNNRDLDFLKENGLQF